MSHAMNGDAMRLAADGAKSAISGSFWRRAALDPGLHGQNLTTILPVREADAWSRVDSSCGGRLLVQALGATH